MASKLLALCTVLVLGVLALPMTTKVAMAAELQIVLTWTAPGDDGWIGRASQYDVRYSRYAITSSNFGAASKVAGFLIPSAVGGKETMVVTGLTPGVSYYFAVKTRDEIGNWSGISNVVAYSGSALDVGLASLTLNFSSPQPNPARSQTRFNLTLPTRDAVDVNVYDPAGRRVRALAHGELQPGSRDLVWNLADDSGRRVAPGVYLVRAQIGKTAFTRRVSVVR